MTNNVFKTLNDIDCSRYVEQKNGLSYLSWSYAWGKVKENFPEATYTIYENKEGLFYHTDGKTAWVKTGVTINNIEHIEYLPVMDYKNKSIALDLLTSFDINKAIQRSLTKACARHGLGLYIYQGEDLPENSDEDAPKKPSNLDPMNFVASNQKLAMLAHEHRITRTKIIDIVTECNYNLDKITDKFVNYKA